MIYALSLILMVLLGLSLQRIRWWHRLAAWYLGANDPTLWSK